MKILILLTCQETIRIKVILRQPMDWIYLSDGKSILYFPRFKKKKTVQLCRVSCYLLFLFCSLCYCWEAMLKLNSIQYYWDMLLSDCFSAVSVDNCENKTSEGLYLVYFYVSGLMQMKRTLNLVVSRKMAAG